jgi:hypothetical protein
MSKLQFKKNTSRIKFAYVINGTAETSIKITFISTLQHMKQLFVTVMA